MLLISAQWHAPQQVEANTGMDLISLQGLILFVSDVACLG
jgi:hypothetical protein